MRYRPTAYPPKSLPSLLLVLALAVASFSAAIGAEAQLQVTPPKDAAELRAIEDKVKKVVAKVLPSTVAVRVGAAGGSGVIISEDGYVMTAGHVVGKPGQDVVFYFQDGKTAKGKTLGMYKTADAGLMKITEQGKKWPFVEKGSSKGLQLGAWCVAVGHPLGYQQGRPPVVRVGRILRLSETGIQTDCPLVGGDSGGPLFDLDGKLIGINSRIGPNVSMNFHVPVDVFVKCWDRLVKGDSWKTDPPGRDSSSMKAAFRPIVAQAAKCVVRVKCDGKEVALGTVVGPDGWILTKASQLKGRISCHFRDGRQATASVAGIHEPFDLAMLRIHRVDLPFIPWNNKKPEVGQWVAAPGLTDDPLALGVVSVPRRPIPAISGVIGVMLKDGKDGPMIDRIVPKSPAEKAKLQANDVVTHVNAKATPDRKTLVTEVKKHRIGTKIILTIKRGDKTLNVEVQLGTVDTPAMRKRDMQNSMGVGVSKRRDAFPLVLQHDTVVRPIDCGGPLVDLSGKVVGVNIAHGGRTETYCVPADVLVVVMYDLMSGRLNPTVLAQKKAEAARAAAAKRVDEAQTAADKAAAEAKAAVEKAQAQKTAAENAAAEKAAAEKKAAEAKTAAEKAAAELAAAQKRADQAKAAAEQAAASVKAAGEKAQAQKTAAEKAAAEQTAAEKKAADAKAAVDRAAAILKTAEEAVKKAAEEVAKRNAEEEAARKKAEEEAARRKAEEAAAKKKAEEEEAAKKKAEEEAAAKKKAEEEAAAKKKAEEEAGDKEAEKQPAPEDAPAE